MLAPFTEALDLRVVLLSRFCFGILVNIARPAPHGWMQPGCCHWLGLGVALEVNATSAAKGLPFENKRKAGMNQNNEQWKCEDVVFFELCLCILQTATWTRIKFQYCFRLPWKVKQTDHASGVVIFFDRRISRRGKPLAAPLWMRGQKNMGYTRRWLWLRTTSPELTSCGGN